MILQAGHFHARQYGVGRTNSGPPGGKDSLAAFHRALGVQHAAARNAWVWGLLATQANTRLKQQGGFLGQSG